MIAGKRCTFFADFCPISSELAFLHKLRMPPKQNKDATQTKRLRHNFNMTPELKDCLVESRKKSGNTMNGEIHARLEATYDESTQRIAAMIWPFIQKLDQDDRAKFADLIAAMARARA
ncbi:hypothetical protein [Mesorhizobium sp.]|uniref:hypothetical protein n=1 Tax=Mesorhizobium sp. TaxID=1871066 RepID=UPI0011FF0A69|nr:hypothetical protein [Mesorhizobium sp.]TIL29999.1 MAG: hypothetical protein E5Y85_25555 [Mesorhizobium sp.]